MNKISPSVMCINPLDLKNQLEALSLAGIDQYHIDVMDGHFVPNFSLNRTIIEAIKKNFNPLIDIHLMIDNPDLYIEEFAEAGGDIIIPHIETLAHPIRTLKTIRKCGKWAGIAINPATDINNIPYLLDYLDIVCIMTVEPGFAGQQMIPSVMPKVARLRKMLQQYDKQIDIMVDGQINLTNASILVEAGANVLVLGSSGLFNHPVTDFPEVVSLFRHLGEDFDSHRKNVINQ